MIPDGNSGAKEGSLAVYRERYAHLSRATDIVYESLCEATIDGVLRPGTRLREEGLASEFGVSRTPIREALQQLRSEGLVDFSPHQGATVARLTTDDIFAIYLVRESLEGLAARLAARRASPEEHRRMIAVLDAMEKAADREDIPAITSLNLAFHAELRQAASNTYLNLFLTQVEQAVRRFGKTTLNYPGRARAAIDEHRAIVEAVIAHAPDRAEALAIKHMHEARQIRVRMLME